MDKIRDDKDDDDDNNNNNDNNDVDIERIKKLLEPANTSKPTYHNYNADIFAFPNKCDNLSHHMDSSVYLDVPNFLELPTQISININVCIFTINNNHFLPYLTFLCHNYNKKISMVGLNVGNNEEIDADSLINSIINKFTNLLNCNKDQLNYAGYTDNKYTDNIYNTKYQHTYIFQFHDKNVKHIADNYEWVTCWELINSNSVYDIAIEQHTIDFFTHNSSLLYLYDKNNVRFMIPIVVYRQIKKNEIARHTGSFSREKNILYGLNLPYDRFFFNSSYEDCDKPNNIVKRVLLFGDVSFIHNPLTVDNDIFRDTVSYLFNNKLMYAAGNSDYLIL